MIISGGWGAVGAWEQGQLALGFAAEVAGSWHPGKAENPVVNLRHPPAWTATGTCAVSPFSPLSHFSSRSFGSKS